MRFAPLLLASLMSLGVGCSNIETSLADGGRTVIVCDNEPLTAAVLVHDRTDKPAPDAVVSVEYVNYAKTENVVADARGIALVKDKYGPGVVRVKASVNDLQTQTSELNFNGTECSVSVTPASLTLKLQ